MNRASYVLLIESSSGTPMSAPTADMGFRAYWQAMDGTTVFTDAGTTPAANGQAAYRLGESLGVVANSYFDQATEAQRPIYTTGGSNGKSYLLFDVTDDNMVSLAMSNFFANNAKTIILVGNTYTSISDGIVAVRDAGGYYFIRTRAGPLLRWRNYDGNYDESTGAAIVLGTPFVYVAKHDGGNLYDAVNGVAWSNAVASGNTMVMTGLFNIRPIRMHLYAYAVANTVISDGNLTQVVNYFKTQLGI